VKDDLEQPFARIAHARTLAHVGEPATTRRAPGEALTLYGQALERHGRMPTAISALEEAIVLARTAREHNPREGA
jgi:hypothetical protein